jgi:DNA repair protein NreA
MVNYDILKNKKLIEKDRRVIPKKKWDITDSKYGFKSIELKDLKEEFYGASPPTVFIGSKLVYPNVNVGIMSVPDLKDDAKLYDSPNYWSEKEIGSNQIVKFRQSLINSRFRSNVSDVRKNNRLLETVQEVGMASIQSDMEIKLNKKPKPRVNFDSHLLPMGPSAELKNVKLVSNSKIPNFVDKVYSDTDLKSVEGLKYLYKKGLDEHSLSQILSIGVTGIKKNRILVPTRSSITAVDDTIGKQLLKNIRDYQTINNYALYFGGHLGNYYLILLFPDLFSYELFEMVLPKFVSLSSLSNMEVMTDYENFKGRKGYVSETAGGYYAARLPILQFLDKIRKQGSALVLRFVLPEYDIPLGVWVCRNSVRKSLDSKPIYFNSEEEMLKYSKEMIFNNFKFDISSIINRSKLLETFKTQLKLSKWF